MTANRRAVVVKARRATREAIATIVIRVGVRGDLLVVGGSELVDDVRSFQVFKAPKSVHLLGMPYVRYRNFPIDQSQSSPGGDR